MKAFMEYGNQVLPAPTNLALYPFWQGDWGHLKTWKTSSLQDQLSPKGSGPHSVTLTTYSALTLQGLLCGHITLE